MDSKKIYTAVKAFSKRGKLLSKSDFQSLSESRSIDELVTRIKSTKYSDIFSDLSKPFNVTKIEQKLKNYLIDTHFNITKTSGDNILKEYYSRYILWNLKFIIKSKILKKSQAEIESHIDLHAEKLIRQRDITLKALASSDVEESIESLGNGIFGNEISKAFTIYNEKKSMHIFDVYFDKILIQRIKKALQFSGDKDLSHIVWLDIDFYNLLSVLRGKFLGLDEEQIKDFIVTYTPNVSKELFSRIISTTSIKDVFSEISNTYYKNLVPQLENEIDSISKFEYAFKITMYNASKNSFTKMFNASTGMGIVNLLSYEVKNMVAITFAIENKIPSDITISKLILS